MKFWLLLLTFSLSFISHGFSVEQKEESQVKEDYKINFFLPINWASAPKYNLLVAIPEGFRSLQPSSSWTEDTTPLIEFIPKKEKEADWSEIITIHKMIGKNISAEQMLDQLKTSMLAQTKNGKVWKEKFMKETSFSFGILGLTYDLDGKHEVFACKYYSGPYDCVGVQYTIRPKNASEEAAAKEKIENFFLEHTRVETSKPEEAA